MSMWYLKRSFYSGHTHRDWEGTEECSRATSDYKQYLQSIYNSVPSNAIHLANASLHDSIISDIYFLRANGLGVGVDNRSSNIAFLGVAKTNINSSALDQSILAMELHLLDGMLEFAFLLQEGDFFVTCKDATIEGLLARN